MAWEQHLESVLAESVQQACERERAAFDSAADKHAGSVVLYGAGNLGRQTLRGLRTHGTEPLAFADANPQLWDSQVEGVRVFSPDSAVARFGSSAIFVVCIWHPVREGGVRSVVNHLRALGAQRVVPFPVLFWNHPETWLPYYFWDLPSRLVAERSAVMNAAASFSNDASRDAFVRHVRARMNGDFSCLPSPDNEPTYFPRDLFELIPDECFVDCGAFDGDTIREFVGQNGGEFRRIIAFEPDSQSLRALHATALGQDLRDRTVVHPYVLGTEAGKARFNSSGLVVSAVCEEGGVEVERVALDECVRDEAPTFIKMDIEGSEIPALQGARKTIQEFEPVLAICVYHRPADLWRVPLLIRDIVPDYSFFLRMYWMDGFDTVCYAVPPHRLATRHRLGAQTVGKILR